MVIFHVITTFNSTCSLHDIKNKKKDTPQEFIIFDSFNLPSVIADVPNLAPKK